MVVFGCCLMCQLRATVACGPLLWIWGPWYMTLMSSIVSIPCMAPIYPPNMMPLTISRMDFAYPYKIGKKTNWIGSLPSMFPLASLRRRNVALKKNPQVTKIGERACARGFQYCSPTVHSNFLHGRGWIFLLDFIMKRSASRARECMLAELGYARLPFKNCARWKPTLCSIFALY